MSLFRINSLFSYWLFCLLSLAIGDTLKQSNSGRSHFRVQQVRNSALVSSHVVILADAFFFHSILDKCRLFFFFKCGNWQNCANTTRCKHFTSAHYMQSPRIRHTDPGHTWITSFCVWCEDRTQISAVKMLAKHFLAFCRGPNHIILHQGHYQGRIRTTVSSRPVLTHSLTSFP